MEKRNEKSTLYKKRKIQKKKKKIKKKEMHC